MITSGFLIDQQQARPPFCSENTNSPYPTARISYLKQNHKYQLNCYTCCCSCRHVCLVFFCCFYSTTELKMNCLIKFILLRSDSFTRAKTDRHKLASISTNCLVARFIDVSNWYLGGTAKYLTRAHYWGRFLRISTAQTTLSTMLFIMVIGPSEVQFCL